MRKFVSGPYLLFEVLALTFIAFTAWYDGWWVAPLTPEEGEVLFEALSFSPSENQVQATVDVRSVEEFAGTDDGRPFYMLNLIKNVAAQDTDAAHIASIDERYAKVVFPLLFQRASHPVLVASPLRTFSVPNIDENWDAIFIIRYRSRRDLFNIVTTETFQKAWEHKLTTIEKTVVIPSSPILPGINLKWIFGLFLLVIGWVGHKVIQRRQRQGEG